MKIHISSKLTQYLVNIFKTRISPRYFVHNGSMGNPLIPDAEKHALWPFYSLYLKKGMQMQYKFIVIQNYSEYNIEITL